MFYEMEIAGLKRQLSLFPVSKDLCIAAFIMLGDVEITVAAAKELLAKAPDFDIILTAEAKSIPLVYEMTKQAGKNEYVIARKGIKVYMEELISTEVNSITTDHMQNLYIGKREADQMKDKRVLIVDDVISTGESIHSLEILAKKAQGNVVGKMAVLAEGDSMERSDITALKKLPLFNPDGSIKE